MSDQGEIPPIQIGIGLHTGSVVTENIGPESRKQFSISGTTVIISARLEQLNKKYKSTILVSEETIRRIETDRKFTSCGVEQLKGIEKGIEVYRVE